MTRDEAITKAILNAVEIGEEELATISTKAAMEAAWGKRFTAVLSEAGFVVMPAENNDTLRRAVWRAQCKLSAERLERAGTPALSGAAEAVAEDRINDPEQRASDMVAYRAMVAAAQDPTP